MPRLDHRSEEISDHCIMAKFDIFGAQTLKQKKKSGNLYIYMKKLDLLNLIIKIRFTSYYIPTNFP